MEKQEYAQRLFQCLTVSIRPLRVEELAEIFAVRFDEPTPSVFNPDWRLADANEAVLSACSSLISIVSVAGHQVVQFAHFSVKEFLTSERLANTTPPPFMLPHPPRACTHNPCACLSQLSSLSRLQNRQRCHTELSSRIVCGSILDRSRPIQACIITSSGPDGGSL